MTKNEALKMAYDWLNEYAPTEVVEACKEALEQPALTYEDGFAHGYEAHRAEQALEQPAQEPVAWMDSEGRFRLDFRTKIVRSIAAVNKEIPLYTHPTPSWQGLSDGDIQEHLGDELVTLHGWSFVQGVRWANKKLKEKNNGFNVG